MFYACCLGVCVVLFVGEYSGTKYFRPCFFGGGRGVEQKSGSEIRDTVRVSSCGGGKKKKKRGGKSGKHQSIPERKKEARRAPLFQVILYFYFLWGQDGVTAMRACLLAICLL